MVRYRFGLVPLLVVIYAIFDVPSHAQAGKLPCADLDTAGSGKLADYCSGSVGRSSKAQEKVDEINRINSAAQEAFKEQMDRVREELTDTPPATSPDDNNETLDDPVGAPYVSDVEDKVLPDDRVEPTPEELLEQQREREAADLLRESRCVVLMSTYRPGQAQPLPSECMSETEIMSVYMPVGRSRPQLPSSPEPVIDGSNIPSIIDFTLGPSPFSQPSQSISPSLQQLANQIQIDDLPSEPIAGPSPSVSRSNGGSQFSEAQEDSGTGASESSPTSAEGQDSTSGSDSGSAGGVFDRIFEAGKNAREGLRNLQIQVGDRLRGITRDADGAPVKIGSKGDTKTDSNQDDLDINRAQNPANLGKGFDKYDSDLHDTTNKKIDKLLDQ